MTDDDKLRPAVEVWKAATDGYDSSLFGKVGVGKLDRDKADQAAAAIIEADRATCLAALQAHADALVEYGGHTSTCDIMTHGVWSDPTPCTCGWGATFRSYEAFKAGEPT